MIFRKWAHVLLVAAPFIAGCAGFWQDPNSSSSSSGCTTNCTALSSGNFYILNAGSTPQIAGESIVSGKLTAISGSPWTVTTTPYSMAISPNGNYLYVSTVGGVYVYPISSGALQSGSATQLTSDQALAIAVDTSGQWLIEALESTGAVSLVAAPLNTSTGLLNGAEVPVNYPLSNATVQTGKIAISPDDTYVFIALGAGGTIAVPFNAGVSAGSNPFGSSAPIIPVANASGSALSVAVDPGGNLFYIGETLADPTGKTGGLRVFTMSSLGTSALVQASGSPIASGGLAPNAILPIGSAGSGYVYVANGAGTGTAGNITSFDLTSSGSTYTVATGSTVATGIQPLSLAEDADKNFILDVNSLGSPDFSTYTFDSSTAGKLDVQVTATTGASPLAVVAAP